MMFMEPQSVVSISCFNQLVAHILLSCVEVESAKEHPTEKWAQALQQFQEPKSFQPREEQQSKITAFAGPGQMGFVCGAFQSMASIATLLAGTCQYRCIQNS